MKVVAVLLLCAGVLAGEQTYHVPLEITPGAIQSAGIGAEIQSSSDGSIAAKLPNVAPRLERLTTPAAGLVVRIPGADPETLVLLNDQFSRITLKRRLGHLDFAEYMIGYHRSERDGRTTEALYWTPIYRAEGRLKLPGCEVNLVLLDLNGDGIFDSKDSLRGTTLGLDLNNDGRIWGAAEWRKANEIIEVCGRPLQVAEIDPTGLGITFKDSDLKPAITGAVVPSFAVASATGVPIRSDDFRGRVHLLDFWASWCAPCVASLDRVDALARQNAKDLVVIGINVDEPERRSAAERIIADKRPSYPEVIRGLGETDFLWKMFGSMGTVRLSIPLYVVIDKQGVIRYASHGGEELKELIQVLGGLLP